MATFLALTASRRSSVGYYKESKLTYVARGRNGLVPATRRQALMKLRPLVSPDCPFVNLPEAHKGRWRTATLPGPPPKPHKLCASVAPLRRLAFT